MYLHIGNGVNVKDERIIGIFDLDTSTVSGITKRMMNAMEKENRIEVTDTDLPRSYLLYEEEDGTFRLILSRISSAGLRARIKNENYDE